MAHISYNIPVSITEFKYRWQDILRKRNLKQRWTKSVSSKQWSDLRQPKTLLNIRMNLDFCYLCMRKCLTNSTLYRLLRMSGLVKGQNFFYFSKSFLICVREQIYSPKPSKDINPKRNPVSKCLLHEH